MFGEFVPFATLSPSISDSVEFVYTVQGNGMVLPYYGPSETYSIPAIILNEDTTIVSGNGTFLEPYVIAE